MSKRQKIFVIAVATIVVAIALLRVASRGKTYEGKTLEEWVQQVQPYYMSYEPEPDPEVRTAICSLCTNDLSTLVKSLEYDQRSSQKNLLKKFRWVPRPISIRLINLVEGRKIRQVNTALLAFRAIGPDAAPAIPALTKMMCGKNRSSAENAVRALTGLVTNSLPALLQAAADPHCPGRFAAMEALGHMAYLGPDANVAVPVLISMTGDKNPQIAVIAVRALGELTIEPDLTLPVLRALSKHQNEDVRSEAVNAIRIFDSKPTDADVAQ